MTKHTLSAHKRIAIGRKVKNLRSKGLIPANIFGTDIKSVSIQFPSTDFSKLYKQVGESTLIYLHIEGEKDPRPVMVHEVLRGPVSSLVLHVDFHQVNLKEKITAKVPVVLVGESLAQKDGLGILVQFNSELEIEALPTDMPQNIEVDISSLANINESIAAKDIKLSSTLILKSDPETIVAKIEPLAAEEPKEVPVPAEVPTPEGGEPAKTEESVAPQAPTPAK